MEHNHGNNGELEDYCPACTGLYEIDTTPLKQTLSDLDKFRAISIAEHAQTCEGFVYEDAGLESEKKVPCPICWPDDSTLHTHSDNIKGE